MYFTTSQGDRPAISKACGISTEESHQNNPAPPKAVMHQQAAYLFKAEVKALESHLRFRTQTLHEKRASSLQDAQNSNFQQIKNTQTLVLRNLISQKSRNPASPGPNLRRKGDAKATAMQTTGGCDRPRPPKYIVNIALRRQRQTQKFQLQIFDETFCQSFFTAQTSQTDF